MAALIFWAYDFESGTILNLFIFLKFDDPKFSILNSRSNPKLAVIVK
jgi:hypothetical protein